MNRRTFLSTAGLALLSGCSASGSTSETTTTTPDPNAEVTLGTMTGSTHELSDDPDKYEPVFQISARLTSVTGPVTRVKATVITSEGDQTTTWLVPEHLDESRILGSRTVYDEDDVVNPKPGDYVIVVVYDEKGRSHVAQEHELSGTASTTTEQEDA
jgi:hypothetical protein